MRSDRSTALGLSLAVLTAATFSTSGTLARALLEAGWSAGAAVTARVGIAALLLAVPALLALRGRRPGRRALLDVGLFGALAVGAAQLGYFNAVRYLPVGVAMILEYSGIVLVVLWTWIRYGERPGRLTYAGIGAAALGLLLVLDLLDGARLDPLGVLWGLVAATGMAGYYVIAARAASELPPVTMACGGMAAGAVCLLLLGLTGALPLTATYGRVHLGGHETSWLVPVLALSVVAGVVPYVTGIFAARLLGSTPSSFAGLSEVLFAVLIAWLVLGELPTPAQGAGGLFVVGGIVLVQIERARRTPQPLPEPAAV